jgi:transposase
VPKAPLDNNICERALKQIILNRKNAMFFRSQFGAYIGDMYMSLIHTCNLMQVNPFDYLVALQRYSSAVFKNPSDWMPWNFKAAIAACKT